VKENLKVIGVDAWWMDASEPDMHSNLDMPERTKRMGPTAIGPAAEYFNSYSLLHTQGVYDGELALNPDVRPFILTRSGFGGLQRHASAVWSGDVVARWDDFRDQISAGVNLSMSGIPNWTTDIGGFSVENRYTTQGSQAPGRMAGAEPALVPVRRVQHRCSAATASSRSARSTTSPTRGPRSTRAWPGTTSFATG
jgi:hypothetical protein